MVNEQFLFFFFFLWNNMHSCYSLFGTVTVCLLLMLLVNLHDIWNGYKKKNDENKKHRRRRRKKKVHQIFRVIPIIVNNRQINCHQIFFFRLLYLHFFSPVIMFNFLSYGFLFKFIVFFSSGLKKINFFCFNLKN